MRRILKFVVHPGETEIHTGDSPRWLAVGVQGDDVVAWCEAEVGSWYISTLVSVMTGQEVPDNAVPYIGTAQVGAIVVHVYNSRVRHS